MTLSLGRLTQLMLALLGDRGPKTRTFTKLNLNALSERDLADLNLPFEVEGRLRGRREAQKIRRGY